MKIQGIHESKSYVLQQNVGIIKQYTPDYFKLTALRYHRPAGWEESKPRIRAKRDPNAPRRAESISRTRSTIFELALCNDWDYFVTLTVDAKKHDRYDLKAYGKRLRKWINNLNFNNSLSVKYLLIPEEHKDGAWHIHGLIMGLPDERIQPFTLDDNITATMRKKIRRGVSLYNWPEYAQAFGWVSMERIKDKDACSRYLTKYITKQVQSTQIESSDHLYYCSQHLKRAEVVHKGTLLQDFTPDYEPDNDFVKTKVYTTFEDAILYFTNCERVDNEYVEIPPERLTPVQWRDHETPPIPRVEIPWWKFLEWNAEEDERYKLYIRNKGWAHVGWHSREGEQLALC